MARKNTPREELAGWLVPGLGLAAVGAWISTRNFTVGGILLLLGLTLAMAGVFKHERR